MATSESECENFRNRILQGNCIRVLRTLPAASINLVLTDPPYLVGYTDREGRSLKGDDAAHMVLPAFTELYRVLKPDSFCLSFYGWPHIDLFMSAWKTAGFKPVGHIIWRKDYISRVGYFKSCHEQAYLLAKGRPRSPARPLPDVLPWEYSGNVWHPTEKSVSVLSPLIESFSRPGDLVLDPFSGSGSTSLAAALAGRDYCGIELERRYCVLARRRLSDACKSPEKHRGKTTNSNSQIPPTSAIIASNRSR